MTLTTLIRNKLGLTLEMAKLIRMQRQLISDYQDEIRRLNLEHVRNVHGLIVAWLLSLEQPEVDMRESLAAMDTALSHQIAQLEEHCL